MLFAVAASQVPCLAITCDVWLAKPHVSRTSTVYGKPQHLTRPLPLLPPSMCTYTPHQNPIHVKKLAKRYGVVSFQQSLRHEAQDSFAVQMLAQIGPFLSTILKI